MKYKSKEVCIGKVDDGDYKGLFYIDIIEPNSNRQTVEICKTLYEVFNWVNKHIDFV